MGRLTEYFDFMNNTRPEEKKYKFLSRITNRMLKERLNLENKMKEDLMAYYEKIGMSKEQWLKKWRRELKHRNWNPLKTLEHINQQELFNKGENTESKKTMDKNCESD